MTWTTSTLSQECSIAIGGTPARKRPEYWDREKQTSNHWVAISDLHGRYISSTAERISDEGVRNSNAKLVERGSVLLSFKLSLGRTAIAGVDLYTNEAIATLRSDTLDHLFLHYGVQSWNLLADVDQAIKGATLNKAKLKRIPISFPCDREEQLGIAQILDTVDRAIEQTDVVLAKLQRIKSGLIHDLLTRGLDSQDQLRAPIEMSTDLYWKSPVGWIPKDWACDFLDKCATRITVGLATSVTKYYRDSGTRMIRNLNIRRGYFEGTDMVFLDPDFASRFPNKVVQSRDVLTCRTGSNVGDTCLVPAEYAGSHTFTTLITTTIRAKLVPEFLVDYMASEIGVRELGNILVGAGKENLNARQLACLRVRLPPPLEQERIHLRIKAAEESVSRLSQTRAKLIRLKSGVMYDLFVRRVPLAALLSKSSI